MAKQTKDLSLNFTGIKIMRSSFIQAPMILVPDEWSWEDIKNRLGIKLESSKQSNKIAKENDYGNKARNT